MDDSSKQDPIVIGDVIRVKAVEVVPIIELDALSSSSSSDLSAVDPKITLSDIERVTEDIPVAVDSVTPVAVDSVTPVAVDSVIAVAVDSVVPVPETTNMEFYSSPLSNNDDEDELELAPDVKELGPVKGMNIND